MKKLKNLKPKTLLRLCFVAICYLTMASPLSVQAQECIVYVDSSQESTTPPQTCGNSIDYAPSADYPEHTPVKWVRMVWHFMCDDNGQGNFNDVDITNENHNNQSAYWVKVLKEMRHRLKNLHVLTRTDPNFPTPHIPDSRIQFDIQQTNIVYHDNTAQMNDPDNWGDHYTEYVTNNSLMPYKGDALHVFFYPNTYGSGTSWATLRGNKVVHNGDWDIFNDPNNTNYSLSWSTGGSLLHEMLHCLGLNHTNRYGSGGCNPTKDDGCDDTPSSQTLNPCPCWNPWDSPDGLPCSNNVMDYNPKKSALSRCQLGKIHYYLIHNSNVNAYLIEDFCTHQASENITIQNGQDITWKNTRYLKGDLIIEDGAKLTIECVVSFGYNSKIYIEAGGKLVVDGGHLTTICGSDWKGIRVAGNNSLPQNDVNQGVVEFKNDAIIEYARDAVALIGLKTNGSLDWSKTGGIIRAENTTFLNNRRDVEFMSYHSYAPSGREYNNKSYFTECNFITDEDEHGSFNPSTHITMWDVNGVTISGCMFEDKRSYIIPSTNGVVGIGTIKSGFHVRRSCGFVAPCTGPKSKFINLKQAIEANGLNNPQKSIYISNSEFESYRGIELMCVNHARVNNNTFEIKVAIGVPSAHFFPMGLYLDQSTGFRVYDNTFNGDANINNIQFGGAAGLVVRRSGANNDKFHNNNFENLITGSQSIGYNRDALGVKGLIFKCNDYENNLDDMFITKYSTDPGPHKQAGIREDQIKTTTGSLQAADNIFSDQVNFLQYNIENEGSWINYLHRDPAINPRFEPVLTSGKVGTLQIPGSRACNTSYTGIDINNEISTVNTTKPLVVNKRTIWENTVDGGSTPTRLNQIETADPITVNDVYNDILTDAPWVSDEVLLEIANAEAPFTNEMITDILVACPQAARSIDIQNVLDLRNDPLTQQQRDDINNEANSFTDYDTHLDEWAALSLDYQTAIDNILHEYFTDELDHMADLDALLKDEDNVNNYYLLAEIYYSKGMVGDGDAVVALIPTEFTLNAEEQVSYNDFINYHGTINQWKATSKDFTSLDPADILWLESFGQNKHLTFGNSISLLKLNGESDYYGEVYIPNQASSKNVSPTSVKEITNEDHLKVYPNPVSTILNIDTEADIKRLVVTDILGKEIIDKTNLVRGKHTIDVSSLSKGVYLLSIESKGETKSYKFIKE
jgi:hypothetical protein